MIEGWIAATAHMELLETARKERIGHRSGCVKHGSVHLQGKQKSEIRMQNGYVRLHKMYTHIQVGGLGLFFIFPYFGNNHPN